MAVDRVYMNALYPERFSNSDASELEGALERADGSRARPPCGRRSPSTGAAARSVSSSSG